MVLSYINLDLSQDMLLRVSRELKVNVSTQKTRCVHFGVMYSLNNAQVLPTAWQTGCLLLLEKMQIDMTKLVPNILLMVVVSPKVFV